MTGEVDLEPRRRVTMAEVRAHRDTIRELGVRYGVSNVRVFGSVARGDSDDDSDLDLLVDVAKGHGLFDVTTFALEVEDLLGVFTQIATVPGLRRASGSASWPRRKRCEERR